MNLTLRVVDFAPHFRVQMKGLPPGSSLVDREGFPLAHIDVHAVRITRHDLVCTSMTT